MHGMLTLRTADPDALQVRDAIRTQTLMEKVPPSVTLIGIVPKLLDPGPELSPGAVLALEEALTLLVAEIESLGLSLHELPQDTHRNYASG
jgi:hypothetical protein